jgi:hypothetical protein
MQGTPHDVENVPPDKDGQESQEQGGNEGGNGGEAAGSPEAPTGPTPPQREDEPGSERDPDHEGPTPDSENPAT